MNVLRVPWERIVVPTWKTLQRLKRIEPHLLRMLAEGKFRVDGGGLLIGDAARLSGTFVHGVLGRPDSYVADHNLLVDQGINKCLEVMWGDEAKLSNWYIGLYANAIAPAAAWTAANVASTSGEITSQSEGYSEAVRQAFTAGNPAAYIIDNLAAKAAFSIVTATSVAVNGAFLISDSTRGGTTGTLSSASQFAATRTLYNGETFELGYKVQLTD